MPLARLPIFFSGEQARRELGYEPGAVWPAIERAVAGALFPGRPVAAPVPTTRLA